MISYLFSLSMRQEILIKFWLGKNRLTRMGFHNDMIYDFFFGRAGTWFWRRPFIYPNNPLMSCFSLFFKKKEVSRATHTIEVEDGMQLNRLIVVSVKRRFSLADTLPFIMMVWEFTESISPRPISMTKMFLRWNSSSHISWPQHGSLTCFSFLFSPLSFSSSAKMGTFSITHKAQSSY